MNAMGRPADAEAQMQAARSGFEALLEKHLLAFADHGAEFYSGSGNDARRAFELAKSQPRESSNAAGFRAGVCDRGWR